MSQNLIRKFLSAIKYRVIKTCLLIQSFLIAAITDKYWLLDWVPRSRTDIQSVMLVRLDVIGDFVLWLDSARAYRQLFPNKKIVLYANSSWVELARQLTHWDDLVSIDMVQLRTDELYRLRTFYKIHRRGFPIAIQPTYSREYMSDMLTRSSSAEVIIGFDCDLSNISLEQKFISNLWYSNLIKSEHIKIMELNRNAEFIRGLGMPDFTSQIPKIPKLLELQNYLKIKVPYIVVFPGASWVPKMWPPQKFAELVKAITNKFDQKIILCGSSKEFELCQSIIDLSGIESVQNFAGRTTLVELVEVIRHSEFVFANDTSAIHIAAATQTLSICLLGGGHYGRFMPYDVDQENFQKKPIVIKYQMSCFDCNWSCKFLNSSCKTVPCVENILVSKVLNEYIAAKTCKKDEMN